MSSLLRSAQHCVRNQAQWKHLNAFISRHDDAAILKAVERAEEAERKGPLNARLIALKDNICTSSYAPQGHLNPLPTTAASPLLSTFHAPYSATVATLLRDSGAVLVGKTNLDEFGMGSHTQHSSFGAVKQNLGSHAEELSAGGSSGGSAVAVATGQCWAALGTDTGGSVRLPAAYNGVVGWKPSYGLLSRWGVIAYANSLDTVGVFGQKVGVVRRVFDVLNVHDSKDPTSLKESTRRRLGGRKRSGKWRVGVPVEYHVKELSKRVGVEWRRTLRLLERHGHTVRSVSLPMTSKALSAYYVLAPAEASSNLAKYDGVRYGTRAPARGDSEAAELEEGLKTTLFSRTRGAGFGDEVKRRILLGAYTLSADAIDNYFLQAQRVRRLVQDDFNRVFSTPNPLLPPAATQTDADAEGVDVLLCPTAPTPPPSLKELQARKEPVEEYVNDVFTVPASLAGLPAISLPVGNMAGDGRSRIGMQILGQFGDDEMVLDFANEMEKMVEEASSSALRRIQGPR